MKKNTILFFILFGIHRTFLRVGFTPLTAIALELLPMMRATTNFTPMLSSECKCNKNTYYLHMLPVVNEQTNIRSFRGVGRSVSRSSTSAWFLLVWAAQRKQLFLCCALRVVKSITASSVGVGMQAMRQHTNNSGFLGLEENV